MRFIRKLFTKAPLVNLALLGVTLLIMLPILELCVRLLFPELRVYNQRYMGDVLFGIPHAHFPNIRLDFPDDTKPANVYRIVVLGDSHSVYVRRDKSYAEVLEELINRQDLKGKKVEVFNGGAAGHSHYQYYLALKERYLPYKPDLAIVSYYLGNDLLDLYRNDDRPSLYFDGNSFIHRPPSFSQYIDPDRPSWLMHSQVAVLFSLFWQRKVGYNLSRVGAVWSIGERSGEGFGAAYDYLQTITRGSFINEAIWKQSMNQILFLKRFPKERSALDRLDFKITQMMKELADREGIKLLYAPTPTKLQVEPDSDPVVLRKTLELCGFDRSALELEEELHSALVARLKQHGIDSVDLKPALRARAKTNSTPLYDETYHITWDAHEVIGGELAKAVLPIVLAEKPPAMAETSDRQSKNGAPTAR